MSETSQFLLITHNKTTMESASTLYGVTMQEPGVSNVVGVRLHDKRQIRPQAEAAATRRPRRRRLTRPSRSLSIPRPHPCPSRRMNEFTDLNLTSASSDAALALFPEPRRPGRARR